MRSVNQLEAAVQQGLLFWLQVRYSLQVQQYKQHGGGGLTGPGASQEVHVQALSAHSTGGMAGVTTVCLLLLGCEYELLVIASCATSGVGRS